MHNGHFRADEPSGRSACAQSMTWDGKNLNAWATPNYELTTMLYQDNHDVSRDLDESRHTSALGKPHMTSVCRQLLFNEVKRLVC